MSLTSYIDLLSKKGIAYCENEIMSRHTTFKIGGPAAVFVLPETKEQLCFAVKAAYDEKIKYFVLGKGSNVLFPDAGYEGAVISDEKLTSVEINGEKIVCDCGVSFTALSKRATEQGLSGLEFAYGIPGSVGGAVYMNAGAYGGEVSQVLESSTCFDAESGEILTISAQEHHYGYRTSCYKGNNCRVVLSATFKLTYGDKNEIKAKNDDFMNRRKSKQPLEYPSAGSVFKRCEGHFTGQMIEELGLKGYTVGGAKVSEKHAGFIINAGNATADDVLRLIELIKEKVKEAYGLSLECEVIAVK